jgi:hypothetical protein
MRARPSGPLIGDEAVSFAVESCVVLQGVKGSKSVFLLHAVVHHPVCALFHPDFSVPLPAVLLRWMRFLLVVGHAV